MAYEQLRSVITGWNNIRYDYDAFIEQCVPERLWAIDLPLLDQCRDKMVVLDIGCGTARLQKEIERRGCKFVGLDPAMKLLKAGALRASGRLIKGVGECLPIKNASVDVIIGGYHSFRYIQFFRLYPECFRVLKPQGILAFTLWNRWALLASHFLSNVKQWKLTFPRFKEPCNDVVSSLREIRMLNRYGFMVKAVLSTKPFPPLNRLPFFKNIFNWYGHWKGPVKAFIGNDIIFICIKKG